METEPFVVSMGDQGQLLTQRENVHMEQGTASKKPGQRGKKGSEDRAHVTDATAGAQSKSTESVHTKCFVGTGQKRLRLGQEIPVAVLVDRVRLRRRFDIESAVRRKLPRLAQAIQRAINRSRG